MKQHDSVRAGLRALAALALCVTTAAASAQQSAKRWYSMPEVPAVAETVPGYEVELSFGTLAPRGTPRPIVERLNAALNQGLDQQGTKK